MGHPVIQCLFIGLKAFVFDPLKIASDLSNISQILRLVKTFDKNTPRISFEKLLRPFVYNFTGRGVFHYLSICTKQKMTCSPNLYIQKHMIIYYDDILLQCQFKLKKVILYSKTGFKHSQIWYEKFN